MQVSNNVTFKKVLKKYSLNNSYFKNTPYGAPQTPYEVLIYLHEHGELPFAYSGSNWLYDSYVEYQKRNGVYNSQFFTPDRTANDIADLMQYYYDDKIVLDACCGFGQLTTSLRDRGMRVEGFDLSLEMARMYAYNTKCRVMFSSFTDFFPVRPYGCIVSNPPYEVPELTLFFGKLKTILIDGGTAILLLPYGFVDKTRPKSLVDSLSAFEVIHRQPMNEKFERTGINGEIVVLEKK